MGMYSLRLSRRQVADMVEVLPYDSDPNGRGLVPVGRVVMSSGEVVEIRIRLAKHPPHNT
jgi:hypothetical protein